MNNFFNFWKYFYFHCISWWVCIFIRDLNKHFIRDSVQFCYWLQPRMPHRLKVIHRWQLCWWLIGDVDDRIIMLATFFVMLVIFSMYQIRHQHSESITNIWNLSPTHLVSKIRHQHRCNLKNVIDSENGTPPILKIVKNWTKLKISKMLKNP